MSVDALTSADDGRLVVPQSSDDWHDWVSATSTRNYVLGDSLIDWLDLYGDASGFERDTAQPDHDPRTDFTDFIFEQGHRFEAAVIAHLRGPMSMDVATLSSGPDEVRDLTKAEETFDAMCDGTPIIHQGVLRDAEHSTYGAPDLLVRSDVLQDLFPAALTAEDASVGAPDLGATGWHYRVVDIKFTTLHFSAGGELDNSGSAPAYKLQLFAYNRALGRVQGFDPPVSHLLGRSWTQRKERGFSCIERLAPVPQDGTLAHKRPISDAISNASRWVRSVRSVGSGWTVLPQPTMPELYPNMSNQQDSPWHAAKKEIAEELEELTLLWQVADVGRRMGHDAGVFRWTEPACTPAVVGVTGDRRPDTLQQILDINRSSDGPPVRPQRIHAAEEEWRGEPSLEFYVDFETVSDLADDFSRIPERGGQALIFMIGCGHVEDGEWSFALFTVDVLSEPEEERVIDAWLDHMQQVRQRIDPDGDNPRVIHWSPAETSTFENAYNSARKRHPNGGWPSPRWFDFLTKVMRWEPVVIRGALGFGLKSVAKALHQHGLIETLWGDGPADGLGAMVGAWWCQEEASKRGEALSELDLMQEIGAYNEVDCRVMMEAVRSLRINH